MNISLNQSTVKPKVFSQCSVIAIQKSQFPVFIQTGKYYGLKMNIKGLSKMYPKKKDPIVLWFTFLKFELIRITFRITNAIMKKNFDKYVLPRSSFRFIIIKKASESLTIGTTLFL